MKTGPTEGKIFCVADRIKVEGIYYAAQIIIEDTGEPFSDLGDSGSLVVLSDGSPVGLLFAGSVSEPYTLANSIEEVLCCLRVGIDGDAGQGPIPDPEECCCNPSMRDEAAKERCGS